MRIRTFLGLFCLLATSLVADQQAQYTPGGRRFAKQWMRFYAGDHEPELPIPLIKAGRAMVPAVCEAVGHQDMQFRRYAITALGELRDKRALHTLIEILENPEEKDYFRGDSLQAIYQIDRKLGLQLAERYKNETNYLNYSVGWVQAVERENSWALKRFTAK